MDETASISPHWTTTNSCGRATPFLPGTARIAALHHPGRLTSKNSREAPQANQDQSIPVTPASSRSIASCGGQGRAAPTATSVLAAEAALDKLEELSGADIEAALDAERTRHDWKPRPFFMPIRVAIKRQGSHHRPGSYAGGAG